MKHPDGMDDSLGIAPEPKDPQINWTEHGIQLGQQQVLRDVRQLLRRAMMTPDESKGAIRAVESALRAIVQKYEDQS